MQDRRRQVPLQVIVGALAFASGTAGLTYEVIWHRLLAVVLGNASFATAAVLSAVMGGMGLGALVMGKHADRGHPLRIYGFLELALGLVALGVPTLAEVASDASIPVLRLAGAGWGSFAVRFVVAALVVLAPAFLLGATFPALARAAELTTTGRDRVGRAVSLVYALNTVGAALGCVLTGYLLLGRWGVRTTSTAAALLDLSVGAVALLVSGTLARRLDAPRQDEEQPASTTSPAWLVLGLAFLSGLVLLGFETLWTRLFRVVFGHDVHAFTAMLASVLAGLAIGSAAYRALPSRLRTHRLTVPILFGALGGTALLTMGLVGARYLHAGADLLGLDPRLSVTRSEGRGLILQAVFAGLTVIPTAAVSGAIFPALCARHPSRSRTGAPLRGGQRTGRVLAANTVGTLVGPLLTPLWLVPTIGIQGAASLLAGVPALAALLVSTRLAARDRRAHRPFKTAAAIAVLVAVGFSTVLARMPSELPRRMLLHKIGPAHLELQHYQEGRSATVAVVRNEINGERQLFVNGINEVTTRLVHDQSFELLGHLGPLLHPDPKRVAVICLGAGIAAGAVAQHDIDELVIVDLEPAVVGGAERFVDLNHGVLDDPRTTLVIDDGRAHLRTVQTPYDVIVLDSTHPRAVDSWLLYTREFYDTARARLTGDGVLVQWLPLHGLSVDEFRILVGTFREAFPNTTLFTNVGFEPYGQTAYSLLVGTRGDGTVDAPRIAARLRDDERVHAALAPWGLGTAAEILECLHAGPNELARWTDGLPVNTDDLPWTRFVTRYTRAAPMTPDRLLEAFAPPRGIFDPPLSAALEAELDRRWEAQGLLLAGRLTRAAEVCGATCLKPPMFAAAMASGPGYYRALRARYEGDPERLMQVAAGQLTHGLRAEAVETLELAAERAPTDPGVLIHLGLARASLADLAGATAAYREAIRLDPDRAIAHLDLGLALVRDEQLDHAVIELRRAVELDPELAAARAGLGYGLMGDPRRSEASEAALRAALELDPRHRDAGANLGQLLMRQRRFHEASEVLARSLSFAPYDTDLRFDLALAQRRDGHVDAARDTLSRLLEIDPDDAQAREALSLLDEPG